MQPAIILLPSPSDGKSVPYTEVLLPYGARLTTRDGHLVNHTAAPFQCQYLSLLYAGA